MYRVGRYFSIYIVKAKSKVKIELEDGVILIKPAPRQGWEEAARQMHTAADDKLLLEEEPTEFDQNEWTW